MTEDAETPLPLAGASLRIGLINREMMDTDLPPAPAQQSRQPCEKARHQLHRHLPGGAGGDSYQDPQQGE